MTVNQKSIKVKLDAKGEVDAMPRKLFDLFKAENKTPSETSANLEVYEGINIQEMTKVFCGINSKKGQIKFYMP